MPNLPSLSPPRRFILTSGILLLSLFGIPIPGFALDSPAGWPTRNHDSRRSSMAAVSGPGSPSATYTYVAEDGATLNISPTADAQGQYFFGSWGIVRQPDSNPLTWDKFDGRIYSLSLGEAGWSESYPPVSLDVTPYCWDSPRVSPSCPGGTDRNFYNGTVEGTGVLDPDGNLYVGRGDGKLFKISPSGSIVGVFIATDPAAANDPESGDS